MNKPHVHKDVIIAYANGAKIQFKEKDGSWEDVDDPAFYDDDEYRVKPEREIPKSSLTIKELQTLWAAQTQTPYANSALKAIADAAVAKYFIDTEQK